MEKQFMEKLQEIGINLSEYQLKQFEIYFKLLEEWNQKINLTAIIEKNDVYIKHFFDSLCLVKAITITNQKILDVGSGAGFPSLPLKIIYPDLQVTIIDSLNKRIKFLEILCEGIGVDARLIHGRAEEHKFKNNYDIVTARAVANLRVLSEICIPFVKLEGKFIALKGPKHVEEIESSLNAFRLLGGVLEDVIVYDIDDQERSLVIVNKVEKTKKEYPRMFSKIKKSPL